MNAHAVAKYLLSRAVRDSGIKVVLTGEGSDEILAGYPHFRRDMRAATTAIGQDAPREAASCCAELEAANQVSRGLLMPQPGHDARERAARASASCRRGSRRGRRSARACSRRERRLHARVRAIATRIACCSTHLDVERQLTGRDAVNQSLYLWAKTILPNYILSNLGDRMEMAHSVEGRVPFLDHHVVEAVGADAGLDEDPRDDGEVRAARGGAAGLTDTVYTRQKHPFLSPPATLQQDGKLYTLLQDTLRERRRSMDPASTIVARSSARSTRFRRWMVRRGRAWIRCSCG